MRRRELQIARVVCAHKHEREKLFRAFKPFDVGTSMHALWIQAAHEPIWQLVSHVLWFMALRRRTSF